MSASPLATPKMTRRGLLRAGARCGVGLGASALTWSAAETSWLETNAIQMALPRLPRAFDGFRIAHISDVHIEGGNMRRKFPDITRYVTSLGADAIVMTGDYTTHADNWQEEALVAGFQHLKAPHGVFAVLGNHDQWSHHNRDHHGAVVARSALRRCNIHELGNEATSLERGDQKLWICGVDDWYSGLADLSGIIASLPQNACALLLGHEPDFADSVSATGRFDLMLSGHSHGGQIAMPFVGPVHLPRGGRKYPCGRYQIGDMTLYTNRGLGTVDIPLRFCARPEVTLYTLQGAA